MTGDLERVSAGEGDRLTEGNEGLRFSHQGPRSLPGVAIPNPDQQPSGEEVERAEGIKRGLTIRALARASGSPPAVYRALDRPGGRRILLVLVHYFLPRRDSR